MPTFNGTDAADFEVLRKGTEYDTLYGGDGDDELVGFSPHTNVYGGRGNDIVAGAYFSVVGGGTIANPFHDYAIFDLALNGLGDHTTLTSYVEGGDGRDIVIGSGGRDVLYGGDGNDGGIITFAFDMFQAGLYCEGGNDYLDGGRGNDLLVGGQGTDRLVGGDGADTFRFARNAPMARSIAWWAAGAT
jgi:Ca2+-binding RTX toxin-like protein